MNDNSGLTTNQKILNLAPVIIVFLPACLVVAVYFITLVVYYAFPGNGNGVSDIYASMIWVYAMLGAIMIGALLGGIASRYTQNCVLDNGKCQQTCGIGPISDRKLLQGPLFGGNCPIKTKWNDSVYCINLLCGDSVQEFTANVFPSGLPATFNNPSNAVIVYTKDSNTPVNKNIYQFGDACSFTF